MSSAESSKSGVLSGLYADHIERADVQIGELSQRGKNKEAAKWEWFKNELSKSRKRHGVAAA